MDTIDRDWGISMQKGGNNDRENRGTAWRVADSMPRRHKAFIEKE